MLNNMLKLLVCLGAIALVRVSGSPHGAEYLASLSPEQLRGIPREVLEDAMLDVVKSSNIFTKRKNPVKLKYICIYIYCV